MKTHPVPKVGDTVVLNDCGLHQCFGSTSGLSHMKTLRMKITHVESEAMTSDGDTFVVEVDDTGINQFLVDNWCFDILQTTQQGEPS